MDVSVLQAGWRVGLVVVSLSLLNSCVGPVISDEPKTTTEPLTFETLWTVEVTGKDLTYTLRAPFGTFLIDRSSDTDDAARRTSGLKFVAMDWHYETGEPWWAWLNNNGKELTDMSEVRLSASVSTISADIDVAQSARTVHYEKPLKSTRPELRPVLAGPVWNGTATEHKSFNTTYYLIETREPFDGSVIVCLDTAAYCDLHGAKVTDTLRLRSLMIPKDDVANWKQYQRKVQKFVEQAIVDVKPTEESH